MNILVHGLGQTEKSWDKVLEEEYKKDYFKKFSDFGGLKDWFCHKKLKENESWKQGIRDG